MVIILEIKKVARFLFKKWICFVFSTKITGFLFICSLINQACCKFKNVHLKLAIRNIQWSREQLILQVHRYYLWYLPHLPPLQRQDVAQGHGPHAYGLRLLISSLSTLRKVKPVRHIVRHFFFFKFLFYKQVSILIPTPPVLVQWERCCSRVGIPRTRYLFPYQIRRDQILHFDLREKYQIIM